MENAYGGRVCTLSRRLDVPVANSVREGNKLVYTLPV